MEVYATQTSSISISILIGCINVHVCAEYRRKLFVDLLDMVDIDVCVVTETWLKEGRLNQFLKQ